MTGLLHFGDLTKRSKALYNPSFTGNYCRVGTTHNPIIVSIRLTSSLQVAVTFYDASISGVTVVQGTPVRKFADITPMRLEVNYTFQWLR